MVFAALGRQCQSLNGHAQVVNPVYMKSNVAFSYYNEFLSPRQCYFSTHDLYFHDAFTSVRSETYQLTITSKIQRKLLSAPPAPSLTNYIYTLYKVLYALTKLK